MQAVVAGLPAPAFTGAAPEMLPAPAVAHEDAPGTAGFMADCGSGDVVLASDAVTETRPVPATGPADEHGWAQVNRQRRPDTYPGFPAVAQDWDETAPEDSPGPVTAPDPSAGPGPDVAGGSDG